MKCKGCSRPYEMEYQSITREFETRKIMECYACKIDNKLNLFNFRRVGNDYLSYNDNIDVICNKCNVQRPNNIICAGILKKSTKLIKCQSCIDIGYIRDIQNKIDNIPELVGKWLCLEKMIKANHNYFKFECTNCKKFIWHDKKHFFKRVDKKCKECNFY